MDSIDPLIQILARLNDHAVEYVLIGGMAAVVYGSQQVTQDIDVCAPLDQENVRRIHAALFPLNARFRFRPDRFRLYENPAELSGFKNLNLVTDLGTINILGGLPEICSYAEVFAKAMPTQVQGVACRVIDLDMLLAAKRNAGRNKDKPVVRELEVLKAYRDQNPGLYEEP